MKNIFWKSLSQIKRVLRALAILSSRTRRIFAPIVMLCLVTELAVPTPRLNDSTFGTIDRELHAPVKMMDLNLGVQTLRKEYLTEIGESNNKIRAILMAHTPDSAANEILQAELNILSDYYGQFPEVAKLIHRLSDKPWQLVYSAHNYKTVIQGRNLGVEKATIFFDPKSAAKLKFYKKCVEKKPFCRASPADALLHELLHLDAIFSQPDEFIAQGGMSNFNYPYEHERQIILAENKLYKAMSLRDRLPRPQRNDHHGRHILVACITCLE